LPLAVAMIEPPFEAALVPSVGAATLLLPHLFPAKQAAIAVPATACNADEKDCKTGRVAAHSLSQNRCVLIRRHACRKAALDNGTCFVAG
jgi:hypothetical protein